MATIHKVISNLRKKGLTGLMMTNKTFLIKKKSLWYK